MSMYLFTFNCCSGVIFDIAAAVDGGGGVVLVVKSVGFGIAKDFFFSFAVCFVGGVLPVTTTSGVELGVPGYII